MSKGVNEMKATEAKTTDWFHEVCLRAPLRAAVVAAALIGLSACNTLEGVGEDVERAGESVQDAAR
ncbi:MAG: hypothetical protein Cons2KO_13000 [Congregibacter sp.]